MNSEYKKLFMDDFNSLCRSNKAPYEVWKDIIVLFAIEISNTCTRPLKDTEYFHDVWEEREQRYISIAKKYKKEQREKFTGMFCNLVMEYEREPFQDFLGKVYMELGINNKNTSQFFTPYSLCKLMADITMERKQIGKQVHKKGFITIADEACGAGATLIAALERCQHDIFKKFNWQNHVFCVGQDVDETVAMMCYIQLSLLGVASYIGVGNTLIESQVKDIKRLWITPMCFSEVWTHRRFFGNYDFCMRKVNR